MKNLYGFKRSQSTFVSIIMCLGCRAQNIHIVCTTNNFKFPLVNVRDTIHVIQLGNKVDPNGCLNSMKCPITNAIFQSIVHVFECCVLCAIICLILSLATFKSRSSNFQSKNSGFDEGVSFFLRNWTMEIEHKIDTWPVIISALAQDHMHVSAHQMPHGRADFQLLFAICHGSLQIECLK